MLAAGSFVGSATALRAGSKCLAIVATRTPPLVPLAVDASLGTQRAQAKLRDEVLALVRETGETLVARVAARARRLRRAARAPPRPKAWRRPYRVKR